MLCIYHYRKAYDDRPVLQVESLQLDEGIYWIKGENGSGKTTLLKSIAGLIPFEGKIEANNFDLRRQRRLYTKAVSFAEAEPVYPPFLSGTELLKFYLQTKGNNRQAILAMAERLGMTGYLHKQVATYSSGMLKKLSLLLSFTGEPKWILLDEPLITLDVAAVETLRDSIPDASAKGISFLVSSHQELALSKDFCRLYIHQQTIRQEAYVRGAE